MASPPRRQKKPKTHSTPANKSWTSPRDRWRGSGGGAGTRSSAGAGSGGGKAIESNGRRSGSSGGSAGGRTGSPTRATVKGGGLSGSGGGTVGGDMQGIPAAARGVSPARPLKPFVDYAGNILQGFDREGGPV